MASDKHDKQSAAKTLGHYGGLKGGPARSKALTASKRSAIARQGGQARQAKHHDSERKRKGG